MTSRESDLVRVALLDVAVNSPNFSKHESEIIGRVYRRMKRNDKIKSRLLKKWF